MTTNEGLFAGIKVLELAQFVFVPVAGALLADWGAEVVKIEDPVHGDGYRGLMSQGIGAANGVVNLSMEMANRGKRSVALDVRTEQGKDILLTMVEGADVFLTNLLPTTLTRLGLDADRLRTLNPRLIYARGHGYGMRGPDADKPAYDSTAFWARGGMGDTLTPEGLRYPIGQRGAMGDRNGAVHLAFGVAAALFGRERSGDGAVIDVSLLSTAIWTLASDIMAALQGSYKRARLPEAGHRIPSPNPLAANYQCADGRFITLCLLQGDRYWPDLCRAIGRPDLADDPRFSDMRSRAEHGAECEESLASIFATRSLESWRAAFANERFPWEPFQSVTELPADPQVLANGYIGEIRDGDVKFSMPTAVAQVDEKPAELRRAPEHGQHTEEVLIELGYNWEQIAQLKESQVIA